MAVRFAIAPLLILLPPFIGGIVLLVRGLKGVHVSDHPFCRRCRFDLFGLPDGVTTCSECGVDLSQPGTIRHGLRRRRVGLLLAGVFFLLVALIPVGIVTVSAIANFDPQPYKPLFWLKHESVNSTTADAAVQEILRRARTGKIGQSDIDVVTDLVLAEQANLQKKWPPALGDWIEAMHSTGQVDEARWKRYASQAIQPYKMLTRPKVRRGDPLPVWYQRQGSRVGLNSKMYARDKVFHEFGDLSVDRIEHFGGGGSMSVYGGGSSSHGWQLDPAKVAAAPNGIYTVKSEVELDVAESWDQRAPALATKRYNLQTSFELVDADTQTITEIRDASLQTTLALKFKIKELKEFSPHYYQLSIEGDRLPVPVAFKIFVRDRDKEYPFSGFSMGANGNSSCGMGGQIKQDLPDHVDLILRSDLGTALNTLDMTQMWVGEIVIKNVPVIRAIPATAPAAR